MALTLNQYRAAFSRCISSAHKDMGLRYVWEAKLLEHRNAAERYNDLVGRLPMLLAYAQEITARRGEAV